jgi:ligand-binding sensor domain-containing protein
MRRRYWLFCLLSVIVLDFLPLFAQYVRRDEYSSEQARRAQYALDDWISYMPAKRISKIVAGQNYLYFATLDGGILRYELFQNYWDYPYTTSNGLPDNKILDIAYDLDNGILWAVTELDTCLFRPAQKEWACQSQQSLFPYQFPVAQNPSASNRIETNIFYPARYLDLLPNFFANGPWTIVENWHIMDENFDEYAITGFLKDNWERIWLIIDGLGVGQANTFSGRMDVIPYGLMTIEPRVLHYQYDGLWIGGEPFEDDPGRPGIVNWRRDGSWGYYQARWIANLPTNNVRDIAVMGDSVWFATDYGLVLYNTQKNIWKSFDQRQGLFSRDILDLLPHGKKLYVGTDRGINIVDVPADTIIRVKDDNIILATINNLAAQEDTIWAATNRGIFRNKKPAGGWEPVVTKAAISDIPAQAVASYDQEMWFSSPQGIFWLDTRTNTWNSFPQVGMEITGPFSDIVVNDKSVWVSTPEGLLKYDKRMNFWKIFTTEDGLLNNDCRRLLLDGDYIWIPNQLGITQFYWNSPSRID